MNNISPHTINQAKLSNYYPARKKAIDELFHTVNADEDVFRRAKEMSNIHWIKKKKTMDGEDKDIFKGFKSWCKKKVVSAFKSNKEKNYFRWVFDAMPQILAKWMVGQVYMPRSLERYLMQ